MGEVRKNWIVAEPDPRQCAELAHALSLPPLLARLLVLRGLAAPPSADIFLNAPLKELHDPFLMKGMKEAVGRVLQAIRNKEKILVFADYDVDGVAAASLMVHFFREIGVPLDYYIPRRLSEGYGLNEAAVHAVRDRGVTLLITADCGIGAVEEIKKARELGMDVIVTDHHQISGELPQAVAVLNPLREDCPYPYKFLCGTGIVYKFLMGLRAELRQSAHPAEMPNLKKHLDLVALATIADVVPLTGENHILARRGLEELANTSKPGLRALKSVAGLQEKKMDAYAVGFVLAPRLNAAGRLGEAEKSVALLVSENMAEALDIATQLDEENRERQRIQEEVLAEARQMIKKGVNLNTEQSIVLASENWHPGVIGIAASRILESHYRPTILIALADGKGRGSARSIDAFNIHEGLQECAHLLMQFGGHRMAAGLNIDPEKVGAFKSKFEEVVARRLKPEDMVPTLRADGEITLDELDGELLDRLEVLAPFGISNPRPVFVARGVRSKGAILRMGKNKEHLKFQVQNGRGRPMEAVGFYMEKLFRKADMENSSLDILFTPQMNEWNGKETIQLKMSDCRIHAD